MNQKQFSFFKNKQPKTTSFWVVKFVMGLLFLVTVFGLQSSTTPNPQQKVHNIEVFQPAVDKVKPINCKLVEETLLDGTQRFYVDVNSVNCGENICEVIVVRVFFDELGRYQRIDLEPGDELEKAKGKPFTKEDYSKLEEILNNKNSELKVVFKEDLVTSDVVERGNSDIDGISGATSSISPSETVEGAVWTCYTLWHWANGDVVKNIRKIRAHQLKNTDLVTDFLQRTDFGYQQFAIDYLTERKVYDSVTVSAVKQEGIQGDYPLFKEVLSYVEQSPDTTYYKVIKDLFEKGNYKKRVACLNSVSFLQKQQNASFFDELSTQINTFSYQEVEMFLTILQLNSYKSTVLKTELIKLLNNSNFLIARRAYWFIGNNHLELSENQQKKVSGFQKKYENRL
ncbi:hypothetical protein FHR24_001269 [Wenyingzhuangia heitensis]|uniref:HEAT repeat-containing protein n=1 Tax=Wenyingzhuangia heitensis TaxID=1487859 RepID=A0ABX0UAH7_9FLAO|nr:hypothetical protein [Wenyingzhuangia heitensis]NIJ44830.1 hypothetical protein [Wenyingzhuangia heitensis]